MKKGLWVGLITALAVIGLLAMTFGGVYNRLVAGEESVESAWAQVENVYQRRLDLIPNLVETVRGYAAHERQTLEGVVQARAKASGVTVTPDVINDPAAFEKYQSVQGELSSALSRLLVVVERYPELKASQNFLALQTQLEGSENRIAVERRRYNEVAREFNTAIRVFPNSIIARMMDFNKKAYFQAEAGADQTPQVKF